MSGYLTALTAAVTVLALGAGPATAQGGAAPAPGAEAVEPVPGGAAPDEDAPALARSCGQEHDCSFRVLPALSREYTTAVLSVGNAAINCTNKPIDVYRTVVLESSTTDNIGGEISGKVGLEGVIDNTTDVSASATGSNKTEVTHTDHTAPTDKGPNADIANGATLAVGGTVTGAAQLKLSAKATFELAFKATYSHEWKRTSTETTQVKFTVKSGDELQFGVLNAMTRTVGELTVGGIGKLIKNVIVDSPSSVNVSTVVAQTFSARNHCLSLRPGFTPAPNPTPTPQPAPPPGNRGVAGGDLVEAAPRTDGARPVGQYRLAADGSWAPLA
ncbi:hypothetical protein ACWDRR_33560 [Kitasatospora sp. NPDC003701]